MTGQTTISNWPQAYVGISWIDSTEIFKLALTVIDKGTQTHYEMLKAYLLSLNNLQITQPYLDVVNKIIER